jgi:effector-binding domain-containing protein
MLEKPEILQTEEQLTAAIHITVPRSQIREVMGPGLSEVMSTLNAQGITPSGPWFTHHLRMDPEIFDFEISVPIKTPVKPAGRVKPSCVPAARVARTVYRGPYEGLGDAWGEFMDWIAAEGLTPAPNLWECYVKGPESGPDPAEWCTQLNRPLL